MAGVAIERTGLPRIFFDTNDGSEERGYELKFAHSLTDIAAIGSPLCDGMLVVIYMPNELEYVARLKYDGEFGYWLGIPVEGTLRYLDGTPDC